MQKEAYFLKKPCFTLRNSTEWIETIEEGWNVLISNNPKNLKKIIQQFKPPKKINARMVEEMQQKNCQYTEGVKLRILYLNFKIRYINKTRFYFEKVIESLKGEFYGPGHTPKKTLDLGVASFIKNNGPFDIYIMR